MSFQNGQRVRMLVAAFGATAIDREVEYPPGVAGLIDHIDERGAHHVVVGPPGDDSSIVVVIEAEDAAAQMQALAPSTKLTAQGVSYSSIVGCSVMLLDDSGACVGMLGMMQVVGGRAEQEAMRDRLVAAINAGQPERLTTHKNGRTYDVVTDEALFQVSERQDLFGIPKGRIVEDGDKVSIYRNPEGRHFVRFGDEMVSPRFEDVQS